MSRIEWKAQVHCDHVGPVIIADARQYEHWSGTNPYPLQARKALRYWGPLTAELPSEYASKDGGHIWRPAQDPKTLLADRDALIAVVQDTFALAQVRIDPKTFGARIAVPDGRRMTISLSPDNAYVEARDAGEQLWSHGYRSPAGHEGVALFWDKGDSGSFWIGHDEAREELLMLRAVVADDDAQVNEIKALVDAPRPREESPQAQLEVEQGPIVVAYSPHTWMSILGNETIGTIVQQAQRDGISHEERSDRIRSAFRDLCARAEQGDVPLLSAGDSENIATVVHLQPGTYDASFGRRDLAETDGSAVWCRLRRSP